MKQQYTSLSRRHWVRAAILVAGLLVADRTVQPAAAYVDYCRTDPVVHLSNGQIIQLTTSIGDTPSDVASVVYTISAPAGASVQHVTYTGGALSGKEHVRVVQGAGSVYGADTIVSTETNSAGVGAQMRVPGIGSASLVGRSGQDLQLQVGS